MAILLTPQISFTLDEAADFANSCAKKLGIHRNDIDDWSFHKKSLDVRHKNPKFMATLLLDIRDDSALRHLEKAGCKPPLPRIQMPDFTRRQVAPRVAVVGAGPSGLFASWTLARAGVKVDLFERGKDAKSRSNDVAQLMHRGILSTESNICFGEGGAGTYSDGKLMTRTKSKFIPIVLELFSKCCNNDRILYESHPHIGTDKLTPMLLNARAHLESLGVSYHFETRIDDIWIDANRCRGIVVNGEKLGYDAVFLCIGHSADEMFETLHRRGVAMAQKPLAIGVRVEHPQELINRIQYGRYAEHPLLPAAEYAVRFNDEKLPSAFSFCMCPGGRVVPSHTHPDCCVVNGMSGSFRNGRFANSALVVQVGEESFDDGPLGGLHWIRRIEKKAAENITDKKIEELLSEKEKLEIQNEKLRNDKSDYNAKLIVNDKNISAYNEIDLKYQEAKKKKPTYETIKKIIGVKEGDDFQAFVQSLAFGILLKIASKYVNSISGKYTLVQVENQVDFKIHDINFSDHKDDRPVSNMSGGEKFIISLSFALGIADLASQNVRVDSLFLDEGFGTLSGKPLIDAIDALKSLQDKGKMLGVISHIPEVIKQFDQRIKAEPSTNGTSILSGSGVTFNKKIAK